MREFEGRVTYAPCQTDRSSKLCNIATRVDVTVSTASTRTRKTMFHALSDFPAHVACLRRVGGVDIDHGQSGRLRLVLDKGLQLPESPTMQTSPDALSCLDVGADVGQVFHPDLACARPGSFFNDGFAGFVVNMLHMSLLTTGDRAELAFSGPATVGLETTTMGKVFVAVVPQFSAAPDLASTGSREVILTNVKPENATTRNGRDIRNVEDEIEIPDAFAKDQFCFLRETTGENIELMLTCGKWNALTFCEGEQRDGVAFDRVGALVEADGRSIKTNRRNRLVFGNAFVGLKRLVGVRDAVYGLAHHLATQCWKQFADGIVSKMVERYAVPTTVFDSERNDGVAGGCEYTGQGRQRQRLLGGRQQLQGYGTLAHIGILAERNYKCKLNSPDASRPPSTSPA